MSVYPATALVGHRLNAFRLNYLGGGIHISIGGSTSNVLIDSLTISDRLDEVPNTLTATVRGTAPVVGAVIYVALGSARGLLLFAGTILRVTRVWAARNPAHVLHHIEASDPTWRLQARLFSARYQNQSATTIAADILTRAPAGFTPMIEPGLPMLDEISFTNATIVDALVQLARRIGGYTRVDYEGRVYLFTTPETASPPAPLTASHRSLAGVTFARDLTQVITRAIVEGGGSNAAADVAAGATVLPVDNVVWYASVGGVVRSGPQRLTYTGIQAGGVGSLVGPGVTPAAAPTVTPAAGAGLGVGTYQYAYTWGTAAGETRPSPAASVVTTGPLGAPAGAPFGLSNAVGPFGSYFPQQPAIGYVPGAAVEYAALFSAKRTAGGAPDASAPVNGDPVSALGPAVSWTLAPLVVGGTTHVAAVFMTVAAPSDPAACVAAVYMRIFTGGAWSGWAIVSAPQAVRATDGVARSSSYTVGAYAAAYPVPTTVVSLQRVQLAGISVGPGTVTKRRLYRTVANGPTLLFRTEIADNTTTTLLDAAADATLGAAAPAADTSGLVVAAGQVNAGSTTMPVAGTGPFPATGGIVQSGDGPLIKYTGISGNSLTGIPASGPGAITITLPYNQQVVLVSLLLGIPASGAGAIVYPIKRGDPVNVVAIVDDAAAQAALAALAGGDGVRESLLQDGRISLTEATARGRALLAAHGQARDTFTHRSRDANTRSGTTVTVDLPAPTDVHGTYRVQDVTIGTFNGPGLVPPTFTATSSSQRFTFDDLLRQLANTAPAPATGEER